MKWAHTTTTTVVEHNITLTITERERKILRAFLGKFSGEMVRDIASGRKEVRVAPGGLNLVDLSDDEGSSLIHSLFAAFRAELKGEGQ